MGYKPSPSSCAPCLFRVTFSALGRRFRRFQSPLFNFFKYRLPTYVFQCLPMFFNIFKWCFSSEVYTINIFTYMYLVTFLFHTQIRGYLKPTTGSPAKAEHRRRLPETEWRRVAGNCMNGAARQAARSIQLTLTVFGRPGKKRKSNVYSVTSANLILREVCAPIRLRNANI